MLLSIRLVYLVSHPPENFCYPTRYLVWFSGKTAVTLLMLTKNRGWTCLWLVLYLDMICASQIYSCFTFSITMNR